ncbi:patatin-like phospholipase family protein [Parabacteroides sp. PF5-9]|uniref:patatin-like phospholipase family protein n=1 Tax=Parabacteroides sp. PF5-9 TaxID=1742404 RepID=UPI002476A152|nr:patatin-like phospholipase family protein [Parabacteroides sp. PF5-9]MDH6357562.1 NTE family protein [Parabacteroides sp. PF5-9]
MEGKKKSKKVALALSTGGARGLSFIGVIEELETQGFEISSIAGCSIGALIGAAYATGRLAICKQVLCGLTRGKLLSLVDLSLRRNGGLIKGVRIMDLLERHIPPAQIEDLPIPFTVVATDITHGQEYLFDKGDLHEAIRASIAMPGVFEPVHRENRVLIDGGLINPLPLDRVKRGENDLLFGVIAGASDTKNNRSATESIRSILTKSSTLMVQRLISYSVEKQQPDLVIPVPGSRYGVMQFDKAAQIIELGRETAREYLRQL